jgi:hypothetical protein
LVKKKKNSDVKHGHGLENCCKTLSRGGTISRLDHVRGPAFTLLGQGPQKSAAHEMRAALGLGHRLEDFHHCRWNAPVRKKKCAVRVPMAMTMMMRLPLEGLWSMSAIARYAAATARRKTPGPAAQQLQPKSTN